MDVAVFKYFKMIPFDFEMKKNELNRVLLDKN